MDIVIVLAILLAMIVMVCSGKVKLGSVGLFVMFALAVTGVLSPDEAYVRFNEKSILLIAAVFVFSAAIFKTGCSDFLGNIIHKVSSKSKNTERFLIVSIALIMTFASAVLPNTALTAAIIPVVLVAAQRTGVSRTRLLMTTAIFANLGGSVSLLGSPTNLVGRAALEGAGIGTLTFFDFTLIGLPIALLCLIYHLLAYKRLIPNRYVEEKKEIIQGEHTKMTWRQITVLVAFGIFVLSVISESFFKTIPAYAVGLTLCGLLVTFHVITQKEAVTDGLYDIPTWIFIIGTLTLSDAFLKTGANELLTKFVVRVLGERPNEIVLISVLFFIGVIMTQFVTNTGTAGILCPIAVSVALGLGADARVAVITTVIACNCSFVTPMATPANLICAGPGHIKFGDWVKLGIPMVLIAYVCCIAILPLIWPMY